MRSRIAAVSVVVLALLTGCTAVPVEMKTEQVNVPMPAERSADVRLTLRSGDLKLAGGAAGLLEGSVTYPGDAKPSVTTGSRESTSGKVVTVALEQPAFGPTTVSPVWDLRLNGGLPTNVFVSNASGDSTLDLMLADPKLLDIDSASGDVKLGLPGPHPSLSRLKLVSASGNVDVSVTGEYPALEAMDVSCASGNVGIDFTGTWRKSFTAGVSVSSGDVTLVLPRNVNVQVVGGTDSGTVSAEGFEKSAPTGSLKLPPGVQAGAAWIRPTGKASDPTLTVIAHVSSGNLILKVGEKK